MKIYCKFTVEYAVKI